MAPGELETLLAGEAMDRQLAHFALYRTYLRGAVESLGRLAGEQSYGDQNVVNLMLQLAPLAEHELPLVEVFKRVGIQAAAAGSLENTARYLESMANRAAMIGQRTDARSRTAMRYLFDREVDAAYETAAATLGRQSFGPPAGGPMRVVMVVSGIVDNNSGSRVATGILKGLAERGASVRVVATGHVPCAASKAAANLRAAGVPVDEAAGPSYEARTRSALAFAHRDAADVALYLTFPMDAVAKLLSCAGMAPRQVFLNTSYEQFCGRFDAILETVSPEQIAHSVNPKIARYVGTGLIAGESIDRAMPIPRSALQVEDGAVIFGTYGRLQKCVEPGFMNAAAQILTAVPGSVLLLAGPGYDQEVPVLQAHFASAGVEGRVRFLGPREDDVPGLLKSTDVYLDTFPFPGAQSVLEAMWAGVPVVGMRTVPDPNLDPTGTGPTTAVGELFLGDSAPLAPSGDTVAYVEHAVRLARDPALRKEAGARVSKRARDNYSYASFMDSIYAAVRDAGSITR